MSGRMEDLLMGGDSSGSDDSDAETTDNGAPTQAAVPSIVTAADPSSALPPPKPGSKSELTNRLKNLYTAPPIPAPPPAVVQMPPPASGGQQGNDGEGAPVSGAAAALTPPGRRGSVPLPIQVENIHAMAAPSPSSRQLSGNNPSNNPGYIPPMVHTSHRSSPGSAQQHQSQQQQQQQQQLAQQQQHHPGAMPPPMQHGSVGRVPAPLPKARTTGRSAAPSNRVASVPISRSIAPNTAVTGVLGPPPPSPLTTTTQQQQQQEHQQQHQHHQQQQQFASSSRQQYAYAPHHKGSSGSSSSSHPSSQQLQQQHQQPPHQRSTVPPHVQQHQQPQPNSQHTMQMQSSSSSSRDNNTGMLPGVAPALGNGLLTDQEKKEKERFLMFTRVLMKYLEQRDANMHSAAKAQIKECYEKNKSGDPQFRSLTTSMKTRLRSTVGEIYWRKAHDYLDHFLKQKKEAHQKEISARVQQQSQVQQLPTYDSHVPLLSSTRIPPPTVPIPAPQHASGQQQPQQRQVAATTAAQKVPMPLSRVPNTANSTIPVSVPIPASAPTNSVGLPTSTTLPAAAVIAVDLEAKKKAEAKKRKERNQIARDKRAQAAQAKKIAETSLTYTGAPSNPTIMTSMSTASLSAPTSTSTSSIVSVKTAEKGEGDKSKKKKSPVSRSNSLSSITKKVQAVREPNNSLMEMIDHATLIDVKNLPNIFTSNAYKMNVDLNEEQRILLYGDEAGQSKMKNITTAAMAALDAAVDAEARGKLFNDAGVPPLPTTIPSMYDGWGTKNVVSVRNAWAKVRLPERERRLAEMKSAESDRALRERPMVAETMQLITEKGDVIALSSPPPMSPSTADALSIENDKTNHAWFNERRAEQDPALALLSEATERFLKSAIEGAVGKARLRLNLDGVRLWHTLQAHAAARNKVGDDVDRPEPPPASIRLGCDVRRQIALSQGNAAKVYQRMEEAISRRNQDRPPSYDPNDVGRMILESTSMGDLSKKPLLKHAAETADVDAKRKFSVFCGIDSADPPFGRVPKKVVVTVQDIEVGAMGNRMMTIGSRRKRFGAGLNF